MLLEHARKIMDGQKDDGLPEPDFSLSVVNAPGRAPSLVIRGPSAAVMARKVVVEHSLYVGALFDNFD